MEGQHHDTWRKVSHKTKICEVCIDSVTSAKAALEGGASRVELCADLFEGGTTPSLGMIRRVTATLPKTPVYVMIRPRGGDFCYDSEEFQVMREDIDICKEAGVEGVVFGILLPDGSVDVERNRTLLHLARPLKATFHRAFDMTADPIQALEDIIGLGFERVLTSGQESSCLEGLDCLKALVQRARDRVIIVPAGGITERNVHRILEGCGASEFHVSGRMKSSSPMTFRNSNCFMGGTLRPPEFEVASVDPVKISVFLRCANS